METLVLNAANMPIGLVSWKRAVKKVMNEKADLVEVYEDRYLGDYKAAFEMPAIIKLIKFIRPPRRFNWFQSFTRKNVWERDDGVCQYCGKELKLSEMTFDHVIPKVQGGKTRWDNIVSACLKCNTKKADKTPAQAGMKLLKRPIAPKVVKDSQVAFVERLRELKNFPHEKWKTYIYLNVELEQE